MKYSVLPSKISGHLFVPPSKSHTLRSLLFALMASGRSVIHNYLPSPDTRAMLRAIELFGAKIKVLDSCIEIEGRGNCLLRPKDVIQAGNSGLVFRLSTALASLLDSYVIITGDESIRTRRIIDPLLKALSRCNVFAVSSAHDGHAPVIVKGPLYPGDIIIENGEDSQLVSSVLIALSFLPGESTLRVVQSGEHSWVNVTLAWLHQLGGRIVHDQFQRYHVVGNLQYDGFDRTIPGDFSTASYSIAAAVISKQGIKISGLNMCDSQPDKAFIDILQKMGVHLWYCSQRDILEICAGQSLRGIKIDLNHCIDLLPTLAVLACFAETPTEISGVRIARFKESNRITAVIQELQKMGGHLEEKEDGLLIYPSSLRGCEVFSHRDHRIALSLLVAGLGAVGETSVVDVRCISKTYPNFLSDFLSIGARIY